MKNRRRYFLRAIAIVCTFSMLMYLPVSATRFQIDNVKDSIRALEGGQEESRQELEGLQADKAILDGRLSELNGQMSALASELSGLQEQLTQKETDIRLTQEQLVEAEGEEKTQYENMKKRIRFFYEMGDTTLLDALLASESFVDFINRAEYVQNIHEYDRNMLMEYQKVTEEIAAQELKLKGEQQELAALVQQQQEKMDEVQVLVTEVKANLDVTNQEISDAESRLADYEYRLSKQRALEEELEEEKAAADAKHQEELNQQEQENQNTGNQGSGNQDSGNQGSGNQTETPPTGGGSDSDLALLAAIIECEVGNQSYECKLAVGSVVINRVNSPYFPNTILEVLYEKGQFTPVQSGRFAETLGRGANASCVQAASDVLAGTITLDKLFFKRNRGDKEGIVIGDVLFY